MRISTLTSFPKVRSLALLIATAGLLAGCQTTSPETTGSIGATAQSAQAAAEPAKVEPPKPELPMTRSKAAMECWMKTEKGSASVNIDKRADVVTKCIDDKLKSAAAAPKG
jgi:hypothetical protein